MIRHYKKILASLIMISIVINRPEMKIFALEIAETVSPDGLQEETASSDNNTGILGDISVSDPLESSVSEEKTEGNEEPAKDVGGVVDSGECGKTGSNLTWNITGKKGDYLLTISGNGEMADGGTAWDQYSMDITQVIISEGVTSIGKSSLHLRQLEKVSLPSSLRNIDNSAFSQCRKLEEVKFPAGLVRIGSHAFEDCIALKDLSVPASLTEIADDAFGIDIYDSYYKCSELKTISVEEGNTAFDSRENCNALIKKDGNVLIKGCDNSRIPDGVTRIGNGAFKGCAQLKSVSMPDSVTSLGDYAFSYCTYLKDISFSKNITEIPKACFKDAVTLNDPLLPDGIKTIGEKAFSGCRSLKHINIPEGVTKIPSACFQHCMKLKKISIPQYVTEIEADAFAGCESLEEVNIPEGVTKISSGCFCDCKNLEKIKLPEGVTGIEEDAFRRCYKLKQIGVPKSLIEIGDGAFVNDTGLYHYELLGQLTVYYKGDENDWKKVSVEANNELLPAAVMVYDTEIPGSFPVQSVSLDEAEYTLEEGGFAVLRAEVFPRYASATVVWSSDDEKVAAVDSNGKVTALKEGTANIKAEEPGGKSAVCAFTVVKDVNDPELVLHANSDYHDYTGWFSKPARSYMFPVNGGYVTIGVSWTKRIYICHYNDKLKLVSKRILPQELPLWGGAYKSDDAYYIVTGQANPDESPDVECFRVTKYDLNWNRLGSAPLYDCNTSLPFEAGSLSMALCGNYLIVRTCHLLYQDGVGIRHQTNCTFLCDTKNMEICDSMMEAESEDIGYVSHSFKQFMGIDNDGIVLADHGDAYPRAIVINKSCQDISNGVLLRNDLYDCAVESPDINLLEFPGAIGDNVTGATLGGFALGENAYLIAGNSVVQDDRNLERRTHNIFVAATDKKLKTSKIHWLTDYPEGEPGVHTPHLVKFDNNRFLVLWQVGTRVSTVIASPEVYYTEVNENGERISPVYEHEGNLSDCEPVVADGQIRWFVCDGTNTYFYGISTSDITQFTVSCERKEKEIVSNNIIPVKNLTLTKHNAAICIGESLQLMVFLEPLDAHNKSLTWSSSDVEVANVSNTGMVTALKEGEAKIKVTASDGSGCYDECSIKVLPTEVDDKDRDIDPAARKANRIWIAGLSANYYYTGRTIKPDIRVYCGSRLLRKGYDYSVSYKNNQQVTPVEAVPAKKPTVILKFTKNFKGTKKMYFNILPMPLSALDFDKIYASCDGSGKNKIKPELIYNGEAVPYTKKDIELKYLSGNSESDCAETGDYTIRVTPGSRNTFSGSLDIPMTVMEGVSIRDVKVTGYKSSYNFNLKPITPEFVLKYKGNLLREDIDYTVSLNNNTDIGTATAIFRGNNTTFFGTKRIRFSIKGKYILTEEDIILPEDEAVQYYTYSGAKPKVIIRYKGKLLKEGADYVLSYKNNKAVADKSSVKCPQVIIKGKGSYITDKKSGIIKSFSIVPRPLSSLALTVSDKVCNKSNNAYKKTKFLFTDENFVDQKLKQGKNADYTISFTTEDGTDAPKAGQTVKVNLKAVEGGKYTGSLEASYRIINKVQDINAVKAVINGGKPCKYTGTGIEPELSLTKKTAGKTIILDPKTDYEILAYYNNINSGKNCVVLLRGTGDYAGIKVVKFAINAAVVPLE